MDLDNRKGIAVPVPNMSRRTFPCFWQTRFMSKSWCQSESQRPNDDSFRFRQESLATISRLHAQPLASSPLTWPMPQIRALRSGPLQNLLWQGLQLPDVPHRTKDDGLLGSGQGRALNVVWMLAPVGHLCLSFLGSAFHKLFSCGECHVVSAPDDAGSWIWAPHCKGALSKGLRRR